MGELQMFKNVVHLFILLLTTNVSFISDYCRANQSIERSQISDLSTPVIEAVSFNVGNAGDNLADAALSTHCPNFKLCRPASIKAFKKFVEHTPVDLFLLQETQGLEQVLSTFAGGPLFNPELYDAQCDYQACVVWKKSTLSLSTAGCKISSNSRASAVNCTLEKKGFRFQAISAYFPALIKVFPSYSEGLAKRRELSARIFLGKDQFADPNAPMLVAGDFNTTNETFLDDYKRPYPDGFYTVVGRHTRGYGNLGGPLRGSVPEHDFFGAYQKNKPRTFITYSRYGFKKQIDQMFSNFGFRVDDAQSSICPYSGGTRFAGFYTYGLNEADDFDHFPIFGRIGMTKY